MSAPRGGRRPAHRRQRLLQLILASALLWWCALPAGAAPADPLMLSTDGATFVTALPYPLFDAAPRLVPAGSVTAMLWVRNDSGDAAHLTVSVGPRILGTAGDTVLSVTAPAAERTAVQLDAAASTDLLDRVPLRAGAAIPLTVAVSLPPSATEGPRHLAFTLRITLGQDAAVVPVGPSTGGTSDSDGLSYTGFDLVDPLWIAAAALILGCGLLGATQRRANPLSRKT